MKITHDAPTASKVRAIVSEVLWISADEIDGATSLVEYGLDSALAVELVVALEDAFCIRMPEDDVARLRTVNDIVAYLAEESL